MRWLRSLRPAASEVLESGSSASLRWLHRYLGLSGGLGLSLFGGACLQIPVRAVSIRA